MSFNIFFVHGDVETFEETEKSFLVGKSLQN